MLWHRRMGHVGLNSLNQLRNVAMCRFCCKKMCTCIVCLKGKQSRGAFKNVGSRASQILELVHSDVCGPMKSESNGGAKYFLIFLEDYSRKTFVYFLKCKSEVKNKFIEFKNFVEN